MIVGRKAKALAFLTIACLVASGSVLDAGGKKLKGTWLSVSVLPPGDAMGNAEPIIMPELETFTNSGVVLTSSAATALPLRTDEGRFLAAVGLGQGSYKYRSGKFAMTQWRFLFDARKGEPIGYLRIINECSLATKKAGQGQYRADMLHMDMTTPYTLNGEPIVITGEFQMQMLEVMPLP